MKNLPYKSLKDLVAAENLRGGSAAPRLTPTIQSRIEEAASSLHRQQLPLSYAEGGVGTVSLYFKNLKF